MVCQQGDVDAALPQGWNNDGERRDSIEQVFPKFPRLDRSLQVLVGSRDDSDVDGDGGAPAHSLEFPLLQHSQQLGLHCPRQVADFVEEDCPALGALEGADSSPYGPGESPPFMAEQLTFY